jgi:hypothetical protein
MRASFQIAAIFIAVGLGALTVTLLHDHTALIPRPPYGPWIMGRIIVLLALAPVGILVVLGLEDDSDDTDDTDGSYDPAMIRRAVVHAYLISAFASAVFLGFSALVDYLDRAAA